MIRVGAGTASCLIFGAMAYGKDKERIEGWPPKGTRAKLRAKAKAANLTYMAFIAKVLEKAASA